MNNSSSEAAGNALLFICNSSGHFTSTAEGRTICYEDLAVETLLFVWIVVFAFVESCRNAPDEYVEEFVEECKAERAAEGFSSLKQLDSRRKAFHRRMSGDAYTLTWAILVVCRIAITFCYGGTAFAL